MTRQIGNHGLFCLDDDDYAGFALALQCNAQAIDASLDATSDALNGYLDRPYLTWVNRSAQNISTGSGVTMPNGLIGSPLSPRGSNVDVISNGIPIDNSFWPRGVYAVGSTIAWTVGSPQNGTPRTLNLWGQFNSNGTVVAPDTASNFYFTSDYEGSTAGGALTTSGFLVNNGNMYIALAALYHTNTLGPLAVAAGAWRAWAIYLGSGLEL